jgi:hypothetical protein
MDEFDWDEVNMASDAAVRKVREVVQRHRSVGILTWALMHQIEDEVVAELKAGGEHPSWALNMMRSLPVFGYQTDDRPVSFSEDSVAPLIFSKINDAWNLVH